MKENLTMTLLKEFREYRVEQEKRWEQNEERWKANEERWRANEERWRTNEERLMRLEEGRKTDRKEILEVLDTMQKSITDTIEDLKKDMDAKFEKIFAAQRVNDMEHKVFKEKLDAHEKRLNLYNSRITHLENWADDIQNGLYPV